jgi:hypothetical protein
MGNVFHVKNRHFENGQNVPKMSVTLCPFGEKKIGDGLSVPKKSGTLHLFGEKK